MPPRRVFVAAIIGILPADNLQSDYASCNRLWLQVAISDLRTDARRPRQVGLFEILDRQGLAEQIALHFVAPEQSKLLQLLVCLDAFSYGVELEFMGQIDDQRDQC